MSCKTDNTYYTNCTSSTCYVMLKSNVHGTGRSDEDIDNDDVDRVDGDNGYSEI